MKKIFCIPKSIIIMTIICFTLTSAIIPLSFDTTNDATMYICANKDSDPDPEPEPEPLDDDYFA